jgi:hypothetical protein
MPATSPDKLPENRCEPDLPAGEFFGDGAGVGQRAGQPVELGHHQGVALSAGGQRLPQTWALAVGASQVVVDVEPP